MQPAEAIVEAPPFVNRGDHRKVVYARELEVLRAASGRDVYEAGSLLHRDLVPSDDSMLDAFGRRQVIKRSVVPPADELRSAPPLGEGRIGVALNGYPLAVLLKAVLLVRMHCGGDVRGQRPWRRGPDRQRLVRPVEEWKADEERGIGALFVAPNELVG